MNESFQNHIQARDTIFRKTRNLEFVFGDSFARLRNEHRQV